jgi:hypothetical protein
MNLAKIECQTAVVALLCGLAAKQAVTALPGVLQAGCCAYVQGLQRLHG